MLAVPGCEQTESVPVEVEGPERDDGQHLDLPELHRRPAQDVVYHRLLLRPRPFCLWLFLRNMVRTEASRCNVMYAISYSFTTARLSQEQSCSQVRGNSLGKCGSHK